MFWKIVRFPITRIVLAFVFIGAAQIAVAALSGGNVLSVANAAISIVAVCLAYALFVWLVERRLPIELSLRWLHELALGALFGLALFSVIIGVLWLLGSYQVVGTNPWLVMFSALWIGLVPGFIEEIIFRGILYRIIEESLGTWIALISTSLFFGFAHAANPNATLFSSMAIALEAGLMLGITYTLTKRLWVPIGIHFAWNWAQGGIYGVNVSGIAIDGWLKSQLVGPELISGGNFGAEGSIVAVIICLLAFALFLVMTIRRGVFVQPFWVRRRQRMSNE
ncbi:MAG: CPBP family intramembrane metalloprotease [Anaerolineae bacterium]|nr:CPBP family intramembrane metalloprotease [Anaerolineae bacterium]